MLRREEGLTEIYNRFHAPNERAEDILRLRQLHEQLDRAVLDMYGWTDIPERCEFVVDYVDLDDEDDDEESTETWRFRWPDKVRDEVLVRLLELNKQRHVEDELVGVAAPKPISKAKKRASKPRKTVENQEHKQPPEHRQLTITQVE